MSSVSEITYGARLNNAEQLATLLQSFAGYAPTSNELTLAELQALITSIKAQNTLAAGSLQAYSAQVELRQQLFTKKDDSVVKLMSPIASTVRAAYGKASKQVADITTTVVKIRGVKFKKTPTQPDAKTISQSEKSFGSITQNFADMITVLQSFGADYNPSNDKVKVDALKDKLTAITNANTSVTAAYGKLKETRDDRTQFYKDLSAIAQRIKDAVKSQYGVQSSEYKLIRGLKI